MGGGIRKNETGRLAERERETERQRQRHRERHRDTETETDRDRETETERQRQRDRETDKQRETQRERQRETERETERDRETVSQLRWEYLTVSSALLTCLRMVRGATGKTTQRTVTSGGLHVRTCRPCPLRQVNSMELSPFHDAHTMAG